MIMNHINISPSPQLYLLLFFSSNLHVFRIFFLFISSKSPIPCVAPIIWKDKILQKIIIMNHINRSPLPHLYLLRLLFLTFMSSESSSSSCLQNLLSHVWHPSTEKKILQKMIMNHINSSLLPHLYLLHLLLFLIFMSSESSSSSSLLNLLSHVWHPSYEKIKYYKQLS